MHMTSYVSLRLNNIMHIVQDYSVLYDTAVLPVYVRVGILPTCGKHLHDRIVSPRREIWAHKISLA